MAKDISNVKGTASSAGSKARSFGNQPRNAKKTKEYGSLLMLERRQRILDGAGNMIKRLGYENFNIRELAVSVDVAPKTIYNLFGTRECLVVTAIGKFWRDFCEISKFKHHPFTVEGRLERAIRSYTRNLALKPFSAALTTIYNTRSTPANIRGEISEMADGPHTVFGDYLHSVDVLAEGVSAADYARAMTRAIYGTLTSWCIGDISDRNMVVQMVETELVVMIGYTKGRFRAECNTWLSELRQRSGRWLEFRDEVNHEDQSSRTLSRKHTTRVQKSRS